MEGFRYDAHPMGIFISTVAAMSTFYPDAKNVRDPECRMKQIHRLIAKAPTVAAFSYRHCQGRPYNYPNNRLGYTANFLAMMFKMTDNPYEPHQVLARALDILFILHADHEQNCSTNAMRAIGSSEVDPYSGLADGQHRAEDFLGRERHLGAHVGEHSRLQPEAAPEGLAGLRCGCLAATVQHCALLDTGSDHGHYLLALQGRLHRPHLRAIGKTVAQADAARARHQRIDKAVVDAALHHQPRAGRTDLAGMEERGVERVIERRVEVGVIEHDVRVFTAQFQRELLEV